MRRRKPKVDPHIVQLKAKDVKEVRTTLLEQQDGLCLVCRTIPKRPCLDHSHTKRVKGTGLVRGVLCSNCMRYGFSQKELPNILRSMAEYFERDHHPMRHPSEAPPIPKLTKSSYNRMVKALKGTGYKPPAYARSGTLTLPLKKAFKQANVLPEFYGGK